MSSGLPDDRLDSWKEIAAYLGRGVRTVQRWERRAVSSTRAAPLNMSDEFVPPVQQIEAMKVANSKPRRKADHGKKATTNRNRNAA